MDGHENQRAAEGPRGEFGVLAQLRPQVACSQKGRPEARSELPVTPTLDFGHCLEVFALVFVDQLLLLFTPVVEARVPLLLRLDGGPKGDQGPHMGHRELTLLACKALIEEGLVSRPRLWVGGSVLEHSHYVLLAERLEVEPNE